MEIVVMERILLSIEDSDKDKFGDPNTSCGDPESCTGDENTNCQCVQNRDDCDDDNPAINPNAKEILDNGMDDNCDGQIDQE